MIKGNQSYRKSAALAGAAVLAMAVFAAGGQAAAPQKPGKPALLVIDVQNAYMPRMSQEDVKAAVPAINRAIEVFRKLGLPVIRVYHSEPGRGPNPGSEAFEFAPGIAVSKDDPMIVKNFGSAFRKTDLTGILREKGVDTVFLCGLSAVGCVLATYHGAGEHDFAARMVRDGLISHNSAYTRMIRDICSGWNSGSLEERLAGKNPY